ncbi:hypothetical protein CEXT_448091 [Caerostris extrusa]|uniref:Uncharacterized protein n=1 Tax=Caerostris extrusa TaxID=172846 RepID=A0AAV4PJ20_CAEEX|nr:hypothetical protein CEXT_448091 [Caerostris extrusa]
MMDLPSSAVVTLTTFTGGTVSECIFRHNANEVQRDRGQGSQSGQVVGAGHYQLRCLTIPTGILNDKLIMHKKLRCELNDNENSSFNV